MPLPEKTYLPALLARVLRLSDTTEHPAFVVGGFIRDVAAGRPSPDIDVAVRGDALQLAREMAVLTGGSYVALKEERNIARVVMPASLQDELMEAPGAVSTVDFVGFEGDIAEDLARRDFTVDAVAVAATVLADFVEHPGSGVAPLLREALDPYGGLPDLEARLLRAVSPTVFEADPGRLLRAVRLAAELGLTFERRTEDLLRASVELVATVPGERTREELLRLLALNGAADSIKYMDRLGLLGALLPELEAARGIEQPTSHFWDVLEHSIQSVATFEFIAGEGDWSYGNDEMRAFLPSHPAFRAYLDEPLSQEATHAQLIKLACLLHDVAKPQTKTLTDTGRARFLGHTSEGAAASYDILHRLRFSQQECAYVKALVHDHLRPAQMSSEGLPSSRAVFRFFRDTKDAGFGILYLALADYLACRGPLYTMSEWETVCDLARFIIDEQERQSEAVQPSRLVDGNDLMRTLGIQRGPVIGRLLDTILEAQASGQVVTREEALELAKEIYELELKTVRTAK
jgi:poly(A) polymerase